jgi:hypothetical protein
MSLRYSDSTTSWDGGAAGITLTLWRYLQADWPLRPSGRRCPYAGPGPRRTGPSRGARTKRTDSQGGCQ